MNNKLPRLPRAASKHGTEDSDIQPPLQRRKGHLHMGRERGPTRTNTFQAGSSTGGFEGTVVTGEVIGIHGHDGTQATGEHFLPLRFADLLAVVCAGEGLGDPFLLEECFGGGMGDAGVFEVVEVDFVP